MEPASSVIESALGRLEHLSSEKTDGRWLEDLIEQVAPEVREWDLAGCWRWPDWPDREQVMPAGTPAIDVGIDLVARRRSDGRWVAIQAKARKIDDYGGGTPVTANELNKFLSATALDEIWAERWLVTNGDVPLHRIALAKIKMSGLQVKTIDVSTVLRDEQRVLATADATENCRHCEQPAGVDVPHARQTRDCMQREAIEHAVTKLREHQKIDEDGIPRGEARGRIILPCGTG